MTIVKWEHILFQGSIEKTVNHSKQHAVAIVHGQWLFPLDYTVNNNIQTNPVNLSFSTLVLNAQSVN